MWGGCGGLWDCGVNAKADKKPSQKEKTNHTSCAQSRLTWAAAAAAAAGKNGLGAAMKSIERMG